VDIPREIVFALRSPETKKAWISEFEKMPGACPNCGGSGIVAAFIATAGPFPTPPGPYAEMDGNNGRRIHVCAHSDMING
jgi:hypothetical protein